MFLLKLGWKLQNLIKKFQSILKIKQNADWISTKWNAHTSGIFLKYLKHLQEEKERCLCLTRELLTLRETFMTEYILSNIER